MWRTYDGSLCREVPVLEARPAAFADLPVSPGSAEDLVRRALGVERYYEHQARIIESLEAGKSFVVSLPFASGRTTAILAGLLPRILEGTQGVTIVCPTGESARRQVALWRGLLEAAHLQWLVDVIDLTPGTGGNLPKEGRFGTIVVTDYAALGSVLGTRSRELETLFRHQSWIVLEDLEILAGAVAAHAPCVLGRLRYFLARRGLHPPVVAVLPMVDNANEAIRGFGIDVGRDLGVLADGAPVSRRHLSVWVPAAYDIDTRVPREARPPFSVKLVRKKYYAELAEVASTSCASGRVTAIISGDVDVSSTEWNQVRAGAMAGAAGGPDEARLAKRLFVAADLASLRARLREKGRDLADLDAVIFAGYRDPAASLEYVTRHLGDPSGGRTLDVVLLAPRTPYYQYLLNHVDELGFGGGRVRASEAAPYRNVYSLPTRTAEVQEFHAREFLEEARSSGSSIDVTVASNVLPSDLLHRLKGWNWEAGGLDPAADDSRAALARLEVTRRGAVAVRVEAGGPPLLWVDEDVALRRLYPNAVLVVGQQRYLVKERVGPAVLVQAIPNASMTERISRVEVQVDDGAMIQPMAKRAALDSGPTFAFGVGRAHVVEEILGRRTYQALDFTDEAEPELLERSIERKFDAAVCILDLGAGATAHTIAHLLRASLALERGTARFPLQVVANDQGRVFVYDDDTHSEEFVKYLDAEGVLLTALRRCYELLRDCPCQGTTTCPGCLGDWTCTAEAHEIDKFGTMEFLGKLLGMPAEDLALARKVTETARLEHLAGDILRVMQDKLRAAVKRPFACYLRELEPPLGGLCVYEKREILVVPEKDPSETQDILAHEYFHDFQGEGNLASSLRHYDRYDIDDPRNVPFQGKLFSEGSANWASVVTSDYWGSQERVLQNTLSGEHEYREGYKVIARLHRDFGIPRTLDFLRTGAIDGATAEVRKVYEEGGASAAIYDQGQKLIKDRCELQCLRKGYRDRETSAVAVSHYLCREKKFAKLTSEEYDDVGPGFLEMVRWIVNGRIGDLSVGDFRTTYALFHADAVLQRCFRRDYRDRDLDVPCLGACSSADIERLEDACMLHKGRWVFRRVQLHLLLGIPRALIRRLLTRGERGGGDGGRSGEDGEGGGDGEGI